MRPQVIVVVTPCLDRFARLGEGEEDVLVEAFVAQAAVEHGAATETDQKWLARHLKIRQTAWQYNTLGAERQMITIIKAERLPVIQNGALHGIVSIGDVVKQRLEEVQSEAEELRRYIRSP